MAQFSISSNERVGISDAATGSDEVKISLRHCLSVDLLWSSLDSARKARTLEDEMAGQGVMDSEHRSYVMNTIMSAVAFLEAFVNETYDDAASMPTFTPTAGSFDDRARNLIGEYWNASGRGKGRLGVLDKYHFALIFAGVEGFNKGRRPYQDASSLIKVRNKLVHFSPAWQDISERGDLEQILTGRFSPNRIVDPATRPWWPTLALGAGCAEWAVNSALALTDEWTQRLGIPAQYKQTTADWRASHTDREESAPTPDV